MLFIRVLLILTVCIWGWSFVATKICLEFLTPLEVIGLRYLIGLPIMGGILLIKEERIRVARKDLPVFVWAALAITVHFIIQVAGLQYTSATNTGWLIAATPLILAVLSYVFLKEKVTKWVLVGIGVATAGVVLLVSNGRVFELGWLDNVGDWLVFASAHTWAIFTILTRDLARKFGALATPFLVLSISAVAVLALMFATSDLSSVTRLDGRAWLALLFLAVVVQGLAFWFWQEGVARLGATRAGIYLYIEPLATTALAVPYLGEEFGFFGAIGGGLVLAGVFLAERKNRVAKG